MPPRKRARHSTAQPSSPTPAAEAGDLASPDGSLSLRVSEKHRGDNDNGDANDTDSTRDDDPEAAADPRWTPALCTALFRQLIRIKPTGLHRHMHMLSIYTSLLSQGYLGDGHTSYPSPPPGLPSTKLHVDEHNNDEKHADTSEEYNRASTVAEEGVRLRDIWAQLRKMYDLEALDEREEDFDFASAFGSDEADAQHMDEVADEAVRTVAEEKKIAPRPGRKRKVAVMEEEEAAVAAGQERVDAFASPAPWVREFALPSGDENDASGPDDYEASVWAKLKWQKRFPSPTPGPERDVGGPPSPSSFASRRRGRAKVERRESSPPAMPALLGYRDEVPVRFVSRLLVDGSDHDGDGSAEEDGEQAEEAEDDEEEEDEEEEDEMAPEVEQVEVPRRVLATRGRARGRGGRGRGAAAAVARRSSRVASVVEDSEGGDADEDRDGAGDAGAGSRSGLEDDEGEESSSSSSDAPDPQETPKKPRGRPAGRGRGRGGPRGRRGKR